MYSFVLSIHLLQQADQGHLAAPSCRFGLASLAAVKQSTKTMADSPPVLSQQDHNIEDDLVLPITIEGGADLLPSGVTASSSSDNLGGAPKQRLTSFWRPLRKALGVTSQARRRGSRCSKEDNDMAIPEHGVYENHEDDEDYEGEDGEGLEGEDSDDARDLSSSVVLDMDGTSTEGKKRSRRRRLHDKARARSICDLVPGMISEEAEQGLEMLAHAVAADNHAAQVEAAEAHAAAEGDTRQPLLRGSLGETQRILSRANGGQGGEQTTSMMAGGGQGNNTTLPLHGNGMKASPSYPKDHPKHVHSAGRKVVTAKQQYVRTLTLPKQGQTMEMELALKDLLRYIQNAVRAVHISQQQQSSSINLSQGAYNLPSVSAAAHKESSVSAAAPFLRRGTQHSRTMSAGNIGSTIMTGGGPSTRMLLQASSAPMGGMLNARDVRRLISGLDTESVKSKEMSIAVRRHTVVLNLDIIRCLILWDRIIVVVPEGADSNCFGELEENLRWLRVQQRAFDMGEVAPEEEEFEFLALEAVLMTTNNHFKNRLKDLRPLIIKNSKALLGNGTLNTKHQDALRQLKSKVANYLAKVRSLHKAIFDLLDDEEHLQMLHLTRIITNNQNQQNQQQQQQQRQQQQLQQFFLQSGGMGSISTGAGVALGAEGGGMGGGMGGGSSAAGSGGNGESGGGNNEQQPTLPLLPPLEAEDNDEAEILLESYLGDFNELIFKWELVKEDMQNTENYVQVKLDMARNKLLTIGTVFALINLCFAFGALVSGIFGMNLYNGVSTGSGTEESFPGFVGVVSFIILVMTITSGGVLTYMYMSRIIVT